MNHHGCITAPSKIIGMVTILEFALNILQIQNIMYYCSLVTYSLFYFYFLKYSVFLHVEFKFENDFSRQFLVLKLYQFKVL